MNFPPKTDFSFSLQGRSIACPPMAGTSYFHFFVAGEGVLHLHFLIIPPMPCPLDWYSFILLCVGEITNALNVSLNSLPLRRLHFHMQVIFCLESHTVISLNVYDIMPRFFKRMHRFGILPRRVIFPVNF